MGRFRIKFLALLRASVLIVDTVTKAGRTVRHIVRPGERIPPLSSDSRTKEMHEHGGDSKVTFNWEPIVQESYVLEV